MDSFTKNITTTNRCGNIFRADRLSDIPLHPGQISILSNLCRQPGISQEQLSRLTYLDKSGIARQLPKLEEMGYVVRRESQTDRRCVLVYPTDKAMQLMPRIAEARQAWRDYLAQGLTEEEMNTFSDLLEKVAERAKEYVDNKNKASSDKSDPQQPGSQP